MYVKRHPGSIQRVARRAPTARGAFHTILLRQRDRHKRAEHHHTPVRAHMHQGTNAVGPAAKKTRPKERRGGATRSHGETNIYVIIPGTDTHQHTRKRHRTRSLWRHKPLLQGSRQNPRHATSPPRRTCNNGSGVENVPEGEHEPLLHERGPGLPQARPQPIDRRLSFNLRGDVFMMPFVRIDAVREGTATTNS